MNDGPESDLNESAGAVDWAFKTLNPDRILTALESTGLCPDGHLLALNSYENRVYRIGLEDDPPVVAKFYRPGRWSDAQILEEHDFTLQLAAAGVPVAAPLVAADNESLQHEEGLRFAVYVSEGGRHPAADDSAQLELLGRLVARMHNVAELDTFEYRESVSVDRLGHRAARVLETADVVPGHLRDNYFRTVGNCLDAVVDRIGADELPAEIRLHGDCHMGNVLLRAEEPLLLDFDDCGCGPAIQDLWMFFSGEGDYLRARITDVFRGYEQFRPAPVRQLHLIEPLRCLRMLHFHAWIARRWHDPAFPAAFAWFGTPAYWDSHLRDLGDALERLAAPPPEL